MQETYIKFRSTHVEKAEIKELAEPYGSMSDYFRHLIRKDKAERAVVTGDNLNKEPPDMGHKGKR